MLKTPGGIIWLPHCRHTIDPKAQSWMAFKNHVGNVTVPVASENKKGELVVKFTKFGDWWQGERSARQYEGVDFAPPPLRIQGRIYNMWQGFKIEEEAPSAGPVDISLFLAHATCIMEGDPAGGEFLVDVLAHRVQRPGEKTGLGLVVLGKAGSGKTTFFQLLCKALMFDDHYLITDRPEQIIGKFHLLARKLMVVWEEAAGQDTHSGADHLKHLITIEEQMSEKKGIDAARVRMCFLPVITANNVLGNAVNIEGTDRRWVAVLMNKDHYSDDPDYFSRLFGKMAEPRHMRAVYDFLRARDISKYHNSRDWQRLRPITETYKTLQQANRPPIAVWLDRVAKAALEGDDIDYAVSEAFPSLVADDPVASRAGPETPATNLHNAYVKWLTEEFKSAHGVTGNAFARLLSQVADDTAEKWCTKKKDGKGSIVYTFETVEMVRHRLGPEALPQNYRAALGAEEGLGEE